jgi:hypothetical protein
VDPRAQTCYFVFMDFLSIHMSDNEAQLCEVLCDWPLQFGWNLNKGLDDLDDQLQVRFWKLYASTCTCHLCAPTD